jgi:multidrug efflux system outer membrane protein
MRIIFGVLALQVGLALVPVAARAAQARAPMTLVDAVSYALTHSPTIAQQRATLAQTEHTLAMERTTAFPVVTGMLQSYLQKSANYQGNFAVIGFTPSEVFSQNTAQIGTTYTLQTGGEAFLQLAADRAQVEQAREALANDENQVAVSVTNAYYDVVQKTSIVRVDESDLSYQNVLVKVARAKEKAGVAAGVDVLKAQVQQAKSASTLIGARAAVADARESLALAIGAPIGQTFVFPAEIAAPPLPKGSPGTLEHIAVRSRPDVAAAAASLSAAQFTRNAWDRELFPTVAINAAFGNQFSPTFVNFGVGPNGQIVPLPRVGAPGFWTLSAVSTFQLPFEDYGARHSERVSDDAQVASAQTALSQTRTQVEVDVRQSYRAAQTALAQVSYARDEARLGTESARVAALQYEHGLIALSDVIQTQQQSVVAQSDFIDARVAYVDALVKLRVSLGIYDARSAVADLQ